MDITNFLAISIIGVVLSLAFEYFKGATSSPLRSKLWAVGLSVVVGGVYTIFRDTVLWTTILGVLASASTVYALFVSPNK